MNADKVLESAHATLTGSLPFPEIVRNLLAEGVECYHVDLASKSFSFYSASGGVAHAPILFDVLPPIERDFDAWRSLRSFLLVIRRRGRKICLLSFRRTPSSRDGAVSLRGGC